MNKQPDETTLTLWIDGELEGEELRRIEAWAQDHPELLAERDAIRAMNASIRDTVPASVEPPYPDFFNQRILRHIEDEQRAELPQKAVPKALGIWRWFAVPAAAAAMVLCFYMGTRAVDPSDASQIPSVSGVSSVYTPDGDVSAAMFKSDDASATVIVLEGLDDIPDDLEMVGAPSKSDSGAVMVSTGSFY